MAAPLKRLAIVIREDSYDRLYTPLTFAYLAAKQGVEVDILFVLWAVLILTAEGAKASRMQRQNAAEEALFRDALRRDEVPQNLAEFIRAIKQTSRVRFYGCQVAAKTFGVDKSNLLPEAEGIVDALWFLAEKATPADHCQYF